MKIASKLGVGGVSIGAVAILVAACGDADVGSNFGAGKGSGGGAGGDGEGGTGTSGGFGTSGGPGDGAAPTPCTGIACNVHACPTAGVTTTISGVVLDPAGKVPLYNVAVFVPNSPPKPFVEGASCAPCASLYTGDPITSALTDAAGKFTLKGVPDGANIPLVIQIGKWRKQLTIPNVQQCVDNPQAQGTLKLPTKHDEPGADIPRIAISTGGSDTLECLLQRVGLDRSEYGRAGGGGAGRIEIFAGSEGQPGQHAIPNTSPAAPNSDKSLWDSATDLAKYDIVLLSCEGHETVNPNQQALMDYANTGGRVFASHYHYKFLSDGPFNTPAGLLATWNPGGDAFNGDIQADIVTTLGSGAPFPKGLAMQQWLQNNNALVAGKLPIKEAKKNAVVPPANTLSQAWITDDGQTEYFSANTPTAAADDAKCGRVVFSDLHVGAASGDDPNQPVPTGCAVADLSPQEKALEFMLFDLSSCITPNNAAPVPPPASGVH